MRGSARVVIVGGGVMGCSLLYHLAREGWQDLVLIEKSELTSGSTWHAAGQISHAVSNPNIARMHGYAIDLYRTLEAQTGQSVTWHGCGSLRLAYNEHQLNWLKYAISVGRGLGFEMNIIGPAEIHQLHPFYNLDGVLAAIHTPNDGHLDPSGACQALAQGARRLGAEIVRFNRVTNIETTGGEWLVRTQNGDVRCEHVVNAGGCYARQIGEWIGLDLPIVNLTHHYIVTDTVPEFQSLERELPVVRDDKYVCGYIRMEQKSALIGIYQPRGPNEVWQDGVPWEAESELFEPDLDRIMPWLENSMERMPVLNCVGIKRVVHGAIPIPPDGSMLLGPAPGLRNYWSCCGSQAGIAWGPGAGKYLAQLMVHGVAEISMREWDPRRFGPYADKTYQSAKAAEDFCVRYAVPPYPGYNRPAARPNKCSPLYDRLGSAGAVYEEVFGWERPRWFRTTDVPEEIYSFRRPASFGAVAAECETVRDSVGLMDLTAFGKLSIRGRDVEVFLNRMIANLAPRRDGAIALGHFLNREGTIEFEAVLTRVSSDAFYVLVGAVMEIRLVDWLRDHKRSGEQVDIDNVSDAYGCLLATGPRARDLLQKVSDNPLDNVSFPWFSARNLNVAGVEVRALRVSFTGELGWELHCPISKMLTIYDALWEEGQAFQITNFGSYALRSMGLEKGFKAGSELAPDATMAQAGMMRFVKLDKGDFLGRDATLRSRDAPLKIRCVQLDVDAADADCIGAESIYAGDRCVGAITSSAYGHRVKRSLAFAYVGADYAQPGQELEVLVLSDRRRARVLGAPLYDPDSALARASQ